jgi:N-acetylglucosaminyldiphosphoundecaprenol N-acetyl-beta-D-mannosaminyltransferase
VSTPTTVPTGGPEELRLERRCRERSDGPAVNGVRIDELSPDNYLGALATFVSCGHSHVVHFCAAHPTVEARHDSGYRALLNKGSLNVPDGMPVAWAAKLSGSRTTRLAGTDGMNLAATWGVEKGLRHYLYGGTPETLEKLQEALEERYPGILIVGAESPPFRSISDDEFSESVQRIQEAGTQALWIGLGAPKQDLAAGRLRAAHAAPVILCVGAAFDFMAGTITRAPMWMQRTGLEWLHRLGSEPRRLWRRYLIGNPQFVGGVLRDRLSFKKRRKGPAMNRKTLPTRSLRQLSYATRAALSVHPSLYLPIARRRYAGEAENRIVERDTELVIDGFQRSGNTFSVVAFETAQSGPVRTAHHLHAGAQIVAAVRFGVPTLVLIRDPADSVLSHMIREPGISARSALRNWIRFYEAVLPLKDRVVIGDFPDVVGDFGAVIERVNAKFGTDFTPFEHTDENVARCFALIEGRNRQQYGALAETKVPRPSSERAEIKADLAYEYHAASLAPLRARASAIYRTLVSSPPAR